MILQIKYNLVTYIILNTNKMPYLFHTIKIFYVTLSVFRNYTKIELNGVMAMLMQLINLLQHANAVITGS
jgi:hypothetical protein